MRKAPERRRGRPRQRSREGSSWRSGLERVTPVARGAVEARGPGRAELVAGAVGVDQLAGRALVNVAAREFPGGAPTLPDQPPPLIRTGIVGQRCEPAIASTASRARGSSPAAVADSQLSTAAGDRAGHLDRQLAVVRDRVFALRGGWIEAGRQRHPAQHPGDDGASRLGPNDSRRHRREPGGARRSRTSRPPRRPPPARRRGAASRTPARPGSGRGSSARSDLARDPPQRRADRQRAASDCGCTARPSCYRAPGKLSAQACSGARSPGAKTLPPEPCPALGAAAAPWSDGVSLPVFVR